MIPGRKEDLIFILTVVEKSIHKTFIHLYSIDKEEMDYVMETFPIVKRKDVEKYGTYRTKETILQLYHDFAWIRDDITKM